MSMQLSIFSRTQNVKFCYRVLFLKAMTLLKNSIVCCTNVYGKKVLLVLKSSSFHSTSTTNEHSIFSVYAETVSLKTHNYSKTHSRHIRTNRSCQVHIVIWTTGWWRSLHLNRLYVTSKNFHKH